MHRSRISPSVNHKGKRMRIFHTSHWTHDWSGLVSALAALFLAGIAIEEPQAQANDDDPAAVVPQAIVEEVPRTAAHERADDALPGLRGDSELPQPVSKEHFSAIHSQSPFLRTLNIAETYALRGVAEIGGDPVATLYNRQTKKVLLVTKDKPNEAGIQMVEVVSAQDLEGVAVKVSFAGEVVELKYDSAVVSPQAKSQDKSAGGAKSSSEGARRRPSKEDMARYNSLSDEQKQKFRDYARQTRQKYPDMSREERSNMIRGAMTRLTDGRDIAVDSPSSPSGSAAGSRSGSR